MTKSGFDLDEIERLLAAATPGGVRSIKHHFEIEGNCYAIVNTDYYPIAFTPAWDAPKQGQVGAPNEAEANAALIVALHNSAPAMLTEIRELRAENARLRGHWSALDKALADNIIETDQPHRVRWEGEWHYGPLADAYFAMTSVVRKLARAALGEPQ